MAGDESGRSKHMGGPTVGKAWILIPALGFIAGIAAALLLAGLLPAPAFLSEAVPATATPLPPDPSPHSISTPTPSPSPTSTPSPTPTSTHTHTPTPTPTETPTPPPTPTSTTISLPPPEASGPPRKPPMVTRAEWGSMEITEGYVPHTLERITLHHDGAEFCGGAAERLRGLQNWSQRVRGWVDIPYHFLIDREGNIYEGRPLQFVGDTATEYDPTGHASITVMGNYNTQEINEAQLATIVDLAAWLCYEYSIPPQTIRGHRDHAATACPGNNLYYPYLSNGYIISAVEERLRFEGP